MCFAKKVENVELKERFLKHAATKSEATRVYNIVAKNVPDMDVTCLCLTELLALPKMGRKGAHLVLEVAADILGER